MPTSIKYKWDGLKEALLESVPEEHFIFVPILLLVGGMVYFSLPFEPPLFWILGYLALALLSVWCAIRVSNFSRSIHLSNGTDSLSSIDPLDSSHPIDSSQNGHPSNHIYYSSVIHKTSLALLLVGFGFFWAQLHTLINTTDFIEKPKYNMSFVGKLLWKEAYPSYVKIIIEKQGEKKERLELRGYYDTLEQASGETFAKDISLIGCMIDLKANLYPLSAPATRGAYNPRFSAYFSGLAGRGSLLSWSLISCPPDSLSTRITKLRFNIAQTIHQHLPRREAAIAVALMTGIRGGITYEDRELFRMTGLAHMLAISGMHMGLVTFSLYFLLRFLVALFPIYQQKYHARPKCILLSWCGSLFYLLIAGAPVPTLRAFIMISIIFFSLLLGRNAFSMRNVMLACLFIFLLAPQSIMQAGFQMSFSAVIAIVAFYQTYVRRKTFGKSTIPKILLNRFWLYVVGLTLTSIIAGIATGGVGLYHFHRFANYSVIANLLAMPFLVFLVMPAGLFSLLLMPIGLSYLTLPFMGFGIEKIMQAAQYVVGLPEAVFYVGQSPPLSLLLFMLGLVWLSCLKSVLRFVGIIPLLAGFSLFGTMPKDDILVYGSAWQMAVRDDEKKLQIIGRGESLAMPRYWLLLDGDERSARDVLQLCPTNLCFVKGRIGTIGFLSSKASQDERINACNKADIIITNKYHFSCPDNMRVDIFDKSFFSYGYVTSFKKTTDGRFLVWQARDLSRPFH